MADEAVYSAGGESNKRKYEDSPPSVGRRASGFSSLPDSAAPPTYNAVPPVNEIELAKQKAQEIAARLLNNVDPSKRARVENGAGVGGGFDSIDAGMAQKHYGGLGLGGPPQSASYGYPGPSKKIEIPNGRVGVIIGKGGETIKYLQLQSGAKIQVTRDMDADPNSATRGVDLMGTPDQIAKAEQLINEVLSEADAGGSGIVSRRLTGQPSGAEQYVTKIPNNKVGLVIGKGGETIKNMQARTGARIQVIPLHLPPGDMSKERTLQIDGTSEQIEAAKQLVDEVISEMLLMGPDVGVRECWTIGAPTLAHVMLVFPRHRSGRGWDSAGVIQYYNPISTNRMRNQSMSGGYSQQGYQAKPPSDWAQPGPPMQQPGYGYVQPGAYPGPPQYNMNQPPYSAYPSQPTSGWDQSAAPQNQQSGGYDYYNQQAPPQSQGATGDGSGYGYSQAPAPAYSQGQGYGQDGYGGGYHTSTAAQSGYSQQSQPGYDQPGYSSTYSGASNPTADRHTPSSYGDPNQGPAPAQPSPNSNYPHQGSSQPGYGVPPSYGTQPSSYGSYGTPLAQKYAQPQQSPSATGQPGYTQTDSGAQRPPSSSQTGYYGAQAGAAQGYPPQYNTAAYGGGYSQQPPPAYSSDGGAARGSYDATPPQPTGPAKASPPS